jgi:hypothetical protein
MARNLFAQEGSWLPNVQAGADFANQFDDRIRSRRASTRAAPMIASGDYQGAAGVYGEAGLADETMALRGQAEGLTRQARADERQATLDTRQAEKDKRAEAAEVAEVLKSTATNLMRRIPTDVANPMASAQRRFEAFTQTPIYRNFTPEQRVQVVVEDFTDDALGMFVEEVEKTYQSTFNVEGVGLVGLKSDGTTDTLVAARPKPIAVPQGVTLLDPETRKPIYTNPKTFAPRAPGRPGVSPGLPGAGGIREEDVEWEQ